MKPLACCPAPRRRWLFFCGNQFAGTSSRLITAVPLAVRSPSHRERWHCSTMNSNDTWPSSHVINSRDALLSSSTTPVLTPPLPPPTHTHLNLKALSARSVNNYMQPGRQCGNWMYSELRYGDGQIPINQIHFIAVVPGASYVQTEPNPPTE